MPSATLCIDGFGTRRSPFFECYATPESEFGVGNGRLFPWRIGDSATDDYWILRRRAAQFDVPEMPLEIAGSDAVNLLDKVFARDMRKLRVGRAVYSIACNTRGGMMMDGIAIRLDEERYWYVQANGDFLGWFSAQTAGLDVEVRDPDVWVFQVQGPRSLDILARACDDGAPDDFRYFDVRSRQIAGFPVTVSRTGWTGELGFEVYVNRREVDGAEVWKHVQAAGESDGLVVSSLRSMQIRRIEAGILDYNTDMDQRVTPYEAGLGAFVTLDKADFIGKAALAHADQRSRMHGLRCQSGVPAYGAKIRVADETVGRVLSSAWSPLLTCGIAYAQFFRPDDWPGRDATVVHRDGTELKGAVVNLPFYDEEKRIPRGIDTSIP
jgi:glycine cleavage system aminomethyltransferase T